jgi:D-alanyl-D-alanine carboxypeptidase
VERTAATPESLGWVKGPEPAPQAGKPAAPAPAKVQSTTKAGLPAAAVPAPSRRQEPNREETRIAREADVGSAHVGAKSGWIVQIGATDAADKANDLLIRARAQNRSALASAKPFTEKVKKGEGVLWRARFAGLDAASAEQACRSLRRSGFSCFATRD